MKPKCLFVVLCLLISFVGCATDEQFESRVKANVIWEYAANTSYDGILDHPVKLEDGLYEGVPYVEGGTSRPYVELVKDLLVFGELDRTNGQDAAFLLIESSGGSG